VRAGTEVVLTKQTRIVEFPTPETPKLADQFVHVEKLVPDIISTGLGTWSKGAMSLRPLACFFDFAMHAW
jgi:hypothetical protein